MSPGLIRRRSATAKCIPIRRRRRPRCCWCWANLLLLLGETLLFYLICTFFYVKSRKEWVYFLVLVLGSGLRKAFPWLPAGVWPFLMACLVSRLIGLGFLRLLKRNYAKTVRILERRHLPRAGADSPPGAGRRISAGSSKNYSLKFLI